MPPPKRELCPHPDFVADVQIARVEIRGTMRFMAEVQIACKSCGVRFRFKGLEPGLNHSYPMIDVTGFELRAPIVADAHMTSMMADPLL